MRRGLTIDGRPLAKPRLRFADLLREATVSMIGNPGRSFFTAVGIVLGAAAFVATFGLSTTMSHQVSASFDLRLATEVVVHERDTGGAKAQDVRPAGWQTPAAVHRVGELNGVVGAGRRVQLSELPVSRTALRTGEDEKVKVAGVDSGAFEVIEPRIVLGRTFDGFHDSSAAPVVLLPATVARRLGIGRVGVAVFIADRPFTVIGIFDDVNRQPGVLASAVMPYDAAQSIGRAAEKAQVTRDLVIEVKPGAAKVVGGQVGLALAPEDPGGLEVVVPPDPETLRKDVEGDVAQLAVVLSLVALAIGTVAIGSSASAGIAARAPEIGLRRTLGARPRHLFAQFLTETTMLGTVGGLIGAASGVLLVVVVSFVNSWQPVLDMSVAFAAAGAGTLTGMLAGLLPAWRATRVQPTDALQR